MDIVNLIAALAVLAALAAYGLTQRSATLTVKVYLFGAILVVGAVVCIALLRAAGMIEATWLFDAVLFVLVVLLPLGLVPLLASEQRQDRHLKLLRTSAKMLIPTVERQDLLHEVLDLAHAAVHVDSSSIMLLDQKTRELYFATARAIDPGRTKDYRIPLDHPAIREVWSGQGPIIVPDVAEVPAFRQVLVREGLRSFFGIPMITRGRLVGFLNVHRTRVSELRSDELEVLTALASQAAVAMDVARLHADSQRRYLDTISALASAIEVNDPYTMGHSRRVAAISRGLAKEMELAADVREAVEVAALLHDVGKIGISPSVLRKLGRLTQAERTEVRSHPVLGALVLREVKALGDVAPSVLYHHEWWDGSGYPYGLRGEEIPLPARVIAVADAYEVITSGRPYRAARQPEEAMAEMKRMAGRQFDPEVVDALVRLESRGEVPEATAMPELAVGDLRGSAAVS
ncbi:MAG: HD-GYP domain-containing protein [Chloroflexota bacterium]